MLNIKTTQSENVVNVIGTLAELKIEEGTSRNGKDYVSGQAKINVDQDINGTMTHNVVVVKMFANKLKNDGNPNKVYSDILKYRETYTSLAAAENPSDATRISVTGKLEENTWIDKKTGKKINDFVVSSNFLNVARKDAEDTANYRITGVVLKMTDVEYDNATRKGVDVAVVGYNGKIDVLSFETISDMGTDFISSNWEKGDTVSFTGLVNASFTIKEDVIEQAFGKPIVKKNTVSSKKLFIDGGANPLEESMSYDASDIKAGLAEREERIAALSQPKPTPAQTKPEVDFF